MSRDLRVVGSETFSGASLAEWITALGRWQVVVEGATTWVVRPVRSGLERAFSFEGPLRIEPEDLLSELASSVLTPRWLVEITVPITENQTAWRTALRVGRHLADEMVGVLFDPQKEEILWPRSKRRRVIRLEGAPTNDVEFEWAIPAARFTDNLSPDLLDVLGRLIPEALPRRYGAYEPLQHRLEDGEENFHSLWRDEAKSGLGLFWSSTAPVRGGSVFFPDSRPPDDGVSAGSIQLEIDARVFESRHWRELAAFLLDRLGGLTDAFGGRALVTRRRTGGIPASEVNSLAPAMVWGEAWLGLPDHPAWLTWLPAAYVGVLQGSKLAGSIREADNGSILSLSDVPRSAEDLLPWRDRIPAEYCRLPVPARADRANYLERLGSPIQAARTIPFVPD